MSAAIFSQSPLGRALLHATCMCRHPTAARFFILGLTRNLREWHRYRARRRSSQ
jgi:hypothetical protein